MFYVDNTFICLPTCFFCHRSAAPVFYFGEVQYHVDESDGYVEVKVWRTGTDLSKTGTVTVRSRKVERDSAEGKFLINFGFKYFENN